MFVTVKLKGILGREFGRIHRFRATTPRDVISALEANFPGFRARVLGLKRWNYRVTSPQPQHRKGMTPQQLDDGVAEFVVRPVLAGSGGVTRIIAGVALVAA